MAFTTEIRRQVREEQNNTCAICGYQYPLIEVHHKVPQRKKGAQIRSNAVGLCPGCHDMVDKFQEDRGVSYEEAEAMLKVYFHKR